MSSSWVNIVSERKGRKEKENKYALNWALGRFD